MHRLSLVTPIQFLLAWFAIFPWALAAAPMDRVESRPPHWMWVENVSNQSPIASSQVVSFDRTIELPERVRKANLRLIADFCHVTVTINGQAIVSVEPFHETVDLDLSDKFSRGNNKIEISARPIEGPAAIALRFSIALANQVETLIDLDSHWNATEKMSVAATSPSTGMPVIVPAQSKGEVRVALWGAGRRSAKISPTENYEQWQLAKSGAGSATNKFWTAPGFEVALLKTASEGEGSWISMAFDPQGRLTIAREDIGLLRLRFDDSMQLVQHVETINDQLKECRGLLYAHDALYANANESKGLYRLRDTTGDDHFDEVKLLREYTGGVGHGRNDLALGPEGSVYAIHGDSVDLPATDIIDRSSPLRDNGHTTQTGQGHVIRTDPDGKNWEIVCTGLRNPYGLAVNSNGDWFTYDADAEFDMGAPWYRPTRILHLFSGADFGWRSVTGAWPPYFPDHADNAMPTLDIGKGSPTAVLFGEGTNFPEDYRRALLVLDWTYGRILAVHLEPRGAGYRANAETFLQGRPLNVTDLAVGPDGSLYIITGGRKTQSALYRITYVGSDHETSRITAHERYCAEYSVESRKTLRLLSSMHVLKEHADIPMAWSHLNSHDTTIRHAARVAVEHQPLSDWKQLAFSETRPTALIEAMLAIIRTGLHDEVPAVFERLLSINKDALSISQVWGLVQCYTLLASDHPTEMSQLKGDVTRQMMTLLELPDFQLQAFGSYGSGNQVRGAVLLLMADLGSDLVVDMTVRSLLQSPLQEDRLYGLLVLRNVKGGWTETSLRTYFDVLDGGDQFTSGEGMPKFLSQLRADAVAKLNDQQRASLSDRLVPRTSIVGETPTPSPRPLVRHWELTELEPMLVADSRVPDRARGEALFREVLCSQCHRAGAIGPAVGPDLTHVGSRFSRLDLLRSIVEPSAVVSETYRNAQLVTADGRTITGRIILGGDYRSQVIRIATNPLDATAVVEIQKSEIETISETTLSPMPNGLVDGLKPDEIADLIAYLEFGPVASDSSNEPATP